ncbi:hypothetical protein FHY55_10885 [Oceanicola sp. D3]|uniref:hypothetical protein n=1 Tax=Oceanicola sp. D3 TaxID=2587163 RepID=UPI00111F8159|nr:hypothetical protein [Oceanicola sp. D3]QDC09719.1 hypothetical protein FHY55_10885 [Oceanicola sp. D3]
MTLLRPMCLAAALVAAAPASAQVGDPLFSTEYRGHEVTVYPDGTWAFTDPNVTLSDVTPFADGGCLSSSDGRVSYCGLPEGFSGDQVVSAYGFEEHSFTDRATGLRFTLTLGSDYGHEGDLDYYRQIESQGSGGDVMLAIVGFLTGMDMEGETATVRNGIAVLETGFSFESEAGNGMSNFSIDVMTESQTLTIQASAYNSAETAPPDMQDVIARLTANLTIDGTPLAAWKAAK